MIDKTLTAGRDLVMKNRCVLVGQSSDPKVQRVVRLFIKWDVYQNVKFVDFDRMPQSDAVELRRQFPYFVPRRYRGSFPLLFFNHDFFGNDMDIIALEDADIDDGLFRQLGLKK